MELDINWEEDTISETEQVELTKLLKEGIYQALISGNGPEDGEIGLVMVSDEEIHALNKSYRGIDCPTDVLSFALQEKGEGEPDIIIDGEDTVLGDIVISVERARVQAEEFGHSLFREIVYLAVHGTLHLLGYDHCSDEDAGTMRKLEEQVMEKIGLPR